MQSYCLWRICGIFDRGASYLEFPFLFFSGSPESANVHDVNSPLERYISSTEHKRALVRQAGICVKKDAYPFLVYTL